jgi:sorbitol-specific phosphotransferase system component IIC
MWMRHISFCITCWLKLKNILFSRTGSFKVCKNHLSEKTIKAMYEVIKKGRKHNLSISCQLDLFDILVKPILLYGCETWGSGNNDILEKIHLKFCSNQLLTCLLTGINQLLTCLLTDLNQLVNCLLTDLNQLLNCLLTGINQLLNCLLTGLNQVLNCLLTGLNHLVNCLLTGLNQLLNCLLTDLNQLLNCLLTDLNQLN